MAHLLLIDDDPDLLRDRVRHVLPAPAHRVEIAQTGAEGLERVAAACPDVILLDLRLPDQSGLDILRQLRRFDARIPVRPSICPPCASGATTCRCWCSTGCG